MPESGYPEGHVKQVSLAILSAETPSSSEACDWFSWTSLGPSEFCFSWRRPLLLLQNEKVTRLHPEVMTSKNTPLLLPDSQRADCEVTVLHTRDEPGAERRNLTAPNLQQSKDFKII